MNFSQLQRRKRGSWTRVILYLVMLIIVLLIMFKSEALVKLLIR